MSYRNIYYNYKNSNITLFTWNEEGKRVTRKYDFRPYYYTETGNVPDAYSIFGGKLKKHEFSDDFARRKSIKDMKLERVYGNLPVEQQFLVEKYWEDVKKEDFSQYPLSIFYIDIEVYSPHEFPEEWEAKHPINVITIYNSLKNEFRVFTLRKEFNPDNLSPENKKKYDEVASKSKFKVSHHSNEKDLLERFIQYWIIDYPDIITGWNLPFDIPYIMNRISKKLSQKDCFRLSPVGEVRAIERQKKMGAQYSQSVKDFLIEGITTLDYQDVYMKFNIKPIPDRKLDTILQLELDTGKVEYESSNLAKLADEEWDLFIYYNIEDVNGIKQLEEKLKYLQIARMLGYMGLVPLKKSLDTLIIVGGYCAINALEEDKIIPTFQKDNVYWERFEGAFVKEPIPGIYDHIVSFDLNSLYPNTMITLNLSPETKFGKIINRYGGKVTIEDNNGKETTISEENFEKLIKKNNIAVSKADVLFTQNKKGIMPKLVDEVYNMRVADRNKIKELKSERQTKKIKEEINRLDVAQYAKKIFINSVYGATGNKYFFMSDLDIARSVTLTCQSVIQESGDIITDIINSLSKDKTIQEEILKYNDTDSVAGDSIITTNIGKVSIENLFDICKTRNNDKFVNHNGYDIVPVSGLKCAYSDGNEVLLGGIKNIIRHKVKKKKFKVRYNNKEVYITEDHSMMIERDGLMLEIKPKDYKKGDLIYLL